MDATLDPFRGYCWERRPWRKDTRDIHWYGGGTRHRATEEHEPSFLDYRTGMAVSQEGE
jgi:uncharacterized sulfatase